MERRGTLPYLPQLSETVILPIAGLVPAFVATYERIQMLLEKQYARRCISNASNTTYSQLICGTNEMADERTATDGRIEEIILSDLIFV